MKNEFTYREKNGYLYPELSLPQQTHYPIGKYGNLRLMFIKEHRKGIMTSMQHCVPLVMDGFTRGT